MISIRNRRRGHDRKRRRQITLWGVLAVIVSMISVHSVFCNVWHKTSYGLVYGVVSSHVILGFAAEKPYRFGTGGFRHEYIGMPDLADLKRVLSPIRLHAERGSSWVSIHIVIVFLPALGLCCYMICKLVQASLRARRHQCTKCGYPSPRRGSRCTECGFTEQSV